MAVAATLAFWFHTAICAGFVVLLVRVAAGMRVPVLDSGPGGEAPAGGDLTEKTIEGVFYLSAALYLAYAEIYLYKVRALAASTGLTP